MNTKPDFHGSDLEKIAQYYGIAKDSIVNFGANVNPLGFSESVKNAICSHLDVVSSYPDRAYTTLRQAIGTYCRIFWENCIGAFAGERMLKDTAYIEKTRHLIIDERVRILEELRQFPCITNPEDNSRLLQALKVIFS